LLRSTTGTTARCLARLPREGIKNQSKRTKAARIAREIHDVLAHSLGALGIQIQAARAVMSDNGDGLIARGLTNSEIAAQLFLSNHTIKTHINRIFAKTGSRDRAAAIGYAHRHGID
jgi:ATP/maltotriose-dependent transcriptional regulator MalT